VTTSGCIVLIDLEFLFPGCVCFSNGFGENKRRRNSAEAKGNKSREGSALSALHAPLSFYVP
jgi:hypothetical protein